MLRRSCSSAERQLLVQAGTGARSATRLDIRTSRSKRGGVGDYSGLLPHWRAECPRSYLKFPGQRPFEAAGAMPSRPRLILVEPGADSASRLPDRLKTQGYSAHAVSHPAEGAHPALLDPPAAVVADLWMPSISGGQPRRLLREEAATEQVPVVLRGPDGPRERASVGLDQA